MTLKDSPQKSGKMFANKTTDKVLISTICKQLIQFNIKKKKTTQSKKWAEDLNRHFFKEDIQMTKEYERASTSLIVRNADQNIGITSHRSEWPPSKNLLIINAEECVGKGTLLHCLWECRLMQLLWKQLWSFL